VNPYNVIVNPLRSEKSAAAQANENKYEFVVAKKANKEEIKRAVEEIYKVKVEKVNTMNVMGKWKRVRLIEGRKSDWKKAVVKLKAGETIEIK
jgi:large subunit ribosomal protein L23